MKKFEFLLQRLLETRDQSHIFHWNTTTYSSHIALEQFYKSLLKNTDFLVETFKGKYHDSLSSKSLITLKIQSKPDVSLEEMLKYFNEFALYVSSVANELDPSKDGDIQNTIYDILNETNKLIYLLRLK